MTPEQHQIERMHAWRDWVAAETGRISNSPADHIIKVADQYLAAFDERFPAPQPETPPEVGTDWTVHIPGDTMPFHDGRREVYVQYRSGTTRRKKGFDVRWDTDPDKIREVIRWKFAT